MRVHPPKALVARCARECAFTGCLSRNPAGEGLRRTSA